MRSRDLGAHSLPRTNYNTQGFVIWHIFSSAMPTNLPDRVA